MFFNHHQWQEKSAWLDGGLSMVMKNNEVWINLESHPHQRACFLHDVETGIIALPPDAAKLVESLKQLDLKDPQSTVFMSYNGIEFYLVTFTITPIITNARNQQKLSSIS